MREFLLEYFLHCGIFYFHSSERSEYLTSSTAVSPEPGGRLETLQQQQFEQRRWFVHVQYVDVQF